MRWTDRALVEALIDLCDAGVFPARANMLSVNAGQGGCPWQHAQHEAKERLAPFRWPWVEIIDANDHSVYGRKPPDHLRKTLLGILGEMEETR